MTGRQAGCTAGEGDPATDGCDARGTDGPRERTSGDAAIARIRDRATAVRDRELETALSQLEARGDPSQADREAVADLADRLVEELLAVPESGLREAAAEGDDEVRAETVETALELFG